MKTLNNLWRRAGAAALASVLATALAWVIWAYGAEVGLVEKHQKLFAFLLAMAIVVVGRVASRLLAHVERRSHRQQGQADKIYPQTDAALVVPGQDPFQPSTVRVYLNQRHGSLWRRHVRLLLVVGEPEQIEAIAPGLAAKHWLEDQNTVLLWGGRVQSQADDVLREQWLGLSRWRSLDAVVWALDKNQCADTAVMGTGMRHLQNLARGLRWELPLYLWQVCPGGDDQKGRPSEPVGCVFPTRFTLDHLGTGLGELLDPLRQKGAAQLNIERTHDFLWRLSRDLQAEGIARWQKTLGPLLDEFSHGVPLRGLWFSLPLPAEQGSLNHWPMDPAWRGVVGDKIINRRRVGWSVPRVAHALALSLALAWGVGMLLSYFSNRAQIAHVHATLQEVQQQDSADSQWHALNELMREVGRLDLRVTQGSPWYQRFGLNRNQDLLDLLWPRYIAANNRLMRDPVAARLHQQLSALVQSPAGSPARALAAQDAYTQLKVYLMMAHPDKADAAFLAEALGKIEPLNSGVSSGLWRALSPALAQFYTEQLAAHPDWRIEADPTLVAQARQILLGQLGRRNAEASLYEQVLSAAAYQYPDLTVQQMVGDTDAVALFSSDAHVPGVFTRQAFEGQIRQAIDTIAEARREQVDWVLSDQPAELAVELSPDVLRQRLTERYFEAYAGACPPYAGPGNATLAAENPSGRARQPVPAPPGKLMPRHPAGQRRTGREQSIAPDAGH